MGMIYYFIMARKPGKKTNDSTSIQDNRVMIAARIDQELVKEMKKWGIDHGMTYREIIEQAIRDFIKKK